MSVIPTTLILCTFSPTIPTSIYLVAFYTLRVHFLTHKNEHKYKNLSSIAMSTKSEGCGLVHRSTLSHEPAMDGVVYPRNIAEPSCSTALYRKTNLARPQITAISDSINRQ